MKLFKLLVLFCFAIWCSSGTLFAQDEKLYSYQEVDTKPTFKGGDLNSFTVWVHKNVTYPSIARDNGVQGRIIIQFTVGPDGVVRDIKAIRIFAQMGTGCERRGLGCNPYEHTRYFPVALNPGCYFSCQRSRASRK